MAIVTSLAVAAVVLACAAGAYWISSREVYRSLDLGLIREATALQLQLHAGKDLGDGTECATLASPACFEVLETVDERPVVLPEPEGVDAVIRGESDPFLTNIDLVGLPGRMYVTPLLDGGALLVAVRADQQFRALDRIARFLALLCGIGIVISAALGYAVARYSLRPVARLSREAQWVAKERDPSREIVVDGSDELAQLGESINTMLRALDDALRAQRQLVSDASHELRTPLTGIIANAELLARGDGLTDEQQTRVRAALARSTADMRTLIDDIVGLAQGSEPDIATEDVAFDDVVAEVVEAARAHRPEIDFLVSVSAHTVHGTRARLAKLVSNLVDNAAKFSAAGGAVDITLAEGVLTVRDHGPGIDEADLGLVFERFYRSARSRGTAGSGLGLAMAQQIARAHGAVITAANAPDGGALFTVRLPPSR
ncbi:sensor histidine kinase [Rhodococcus sp. MTM3W5.2]|uniref:HAMP domain-containing sensor histidine kinase n=1 Tax=Rhodococcus sp. MTM3W5.2 TaxID=1805827 RepID=UPI0011AE1A79|nr:HAMP domain-containing sensor histidine kinase [Rhodococcus sp. MTM3W5.2]